MKMVVFSALAAVLLSVMPSTGQGASAQYKPLQNEIRRHGVLVFNIKVAISSKIYNDLSCSSAIYFDRYIKRAVASGEKIDSTHYACRIRLEYDFGSVDPGSTRILSVIEIVSRRGKWPLDPLKVTTSHQVEFAVPKNGTTKAVSEALTL